MTSKLRTFSAAIAFATVLMTFPLSHAASAKEKNNTVEDLRALAKSESWNELFRSVRDIPPAKRDDEWNKIVEQMAVGLIEAEGLPERRASLLRDLTTEFPHLKNSKAVADAGPKSSLADVEKCFSDQYSSERCFDELAQIIAADKKNKELPLEAAGLVMRNMIHWSAIKFFQIAIDRGNQKQVCSHERVAESVISGLALPKGPERTSAVKLAETCWTQLKEPLLAKMGKESTDGYYWQALCPTALKKKALTGLKEKSCRKHLEKPAEKTTK